MPNNNQQAALATCKTRFPVWCRRILTVTTSWNKGFRPFRTCSRPTRPAFSAICQGVWIVCLVPSKPTWLTGSVASWTILTPCISSASAVLPQPPPNSDMFAVPQPGVDSISARDRRDVSDLVAEVEALLQLLPDPFNAKTLLELLSFQLNQLPREQTPVQNLPVLDELRDKLATALLWLNSEDMAIRDNIAGSTQRLAAYIHELFYEKGLAPLKTRLETLGTEC